MRLHTCGDYLALEANAWHFLAADEANHTVLLSSLQAALKALRQGEVPPDPCEARWLEQDGRLTALALLARENWLLSTGPPAAFEALGAALRGATFAGVSGPGDSVTALMRGHGGHFTLHARLPLMRLDTPIEARGCDGRLLRVGSGDHAQVLAWLEAFRDDARLIDPLERFRGIAERMLAQGIYHLWRSGIGTPLCLVGGRLIAPHGARIGPVYTPPALRGRGHAQAAVTALTALLQSRGARAVYLFTDAANPTSNALYARIGFRPAGEHRHVLLRQRESDAR